MQQGQSRQYTDRAAGWKSRLGGHHSRSGRFTETSLQPARNRKTFRETYSLQPGPCTDCFAPAACCIEWSGWRHYWDWNEQKLNKHINNSMEQSLLAELTGSQLVKKLPAFYATRMFTTAFTRTRHLSLFWARSIQFMPPHSTSCRFILILSSPLGLGLSSGLCHSGFLTKILYVLRALPISLIWSPE